MKIAVSQLNYHIGDIRRNCDKIIKVINQAKKDHADLVIFPEYAVCGAYPADMLESEGFVNECRMAIEEIANHCKGIAALVGSPNYDSEDGILLNAIFFMYDGEVRGGVNKTILSDYDIFDESRYFVGGDENRSIRYKSQQLRVIFDEYESDTIRKEDSLIIYVGATPFTHEALAYRKEVLSSLAQKFRIPAIGVNHIGANTSIIFDGNSLIYNKEGQISYMLKSFEEDYYLIDTKAMPLAKSEKNSNNERIKNIYEALILGIREYFKKNRFGKAILGLSGGIDSAVVAILAAEALGSSNVMGVLMPSPFSGEHSVNDAEDLAKSCGIMSESIPIAGCYDTFMATLNPLFKELPFNVAEENLQARIRGTILMALSNKFGYILLNTSNKSESAVGYGTLYGDMCGSLAVLSDLYKTEVYELAKYINRERIVIPETIITKSPSAELRPNQKDQDSLPEYEILDPILRFYIEDGLSLSEIRAKGFDLTTIERIIRLVNTSEYKRAQAPPTLKVSKKAFGSGRRLPLTAKHNR